MDIETDLSLAGDRDCPEGQRGIVVWVQASRYELRRLGSRYEAYVIRSSVRGSGCSLGLSGDIEGTLVPRYLALKTLCEAFARMTMSGSLTPMVLLWVNFVEKTDPALLKVVGLK